MFDPTATPDAPDDSAFHDLARLATQTCAAPCALLHISNEQVGRTVQVGLESVPQPYLLSLLERFSFPTSTVLSLPDITQQSPRVTGPLVDGPPYLTACAGTALVSPSGTHWGVLCVFDTVTREFTRQQQASLQSLGRQAVAQIRLHQMLLSESGQNNTRRASLRQDDRLLDRLVNAVKDYAIYALTPTGDIVSWNSGAEHLKGYTAQEIIGRNFSMFYSEEDRQRNLPYQGLEIARTQGRFEGEGWRYRKDGSSFWANVVITPIQDAEGSLLGYSKVTRDITERKQAEIAVQNSEERFRSAILAINDGLIIQNPDGEIFLSNERAEEILGMSAAVLKGRSARDPRWKIIHPDGTPWTGDTHPATVALKNGTVQRDVLMEIHRPDGALRWLNVSAAPVFTGGDTAPSAVVTTLTDITEQRRLTDEKEALMQDALARADRDGLTSLFNHRTFHHQLRVAGEQIRAARANRHVTSVITNPDGEGSGRRKKHCVGPSLAVAVLDMDNFKFFNDTYGHLVGDDVLCSVADALRTCCREGDIIARIGGDEFAIVLPDINRSEALVWVERLRAMANTLSYTVQGEATAVPTRLSVGMALFPDDAATTADALYLADKRAMQDKNSSMTVHSDEAERLRALLADEIDGFSLLDALIAAVDNKDRYTRRHSIDVMTYAAKIAEELGLTDHEKHSLQVAALVHDVGKIGIPNHLLRQPGSLSVRDFEIVKRHADLGSLLVAAVPELAHTLDAVRYHHERWDGAGYPSGLRGEAIPFAARVLAVAEAYSAMTLDRPYRKGMSPQEARDQLRAGAGSQWDGVCVDALLCRLETEGSTSTLSVDTVALQTST